MVKDIKYLPHGNVAKMQINSRFSSKKFQTSYDKARQGHFHVMGRGL